MNLTIPLYVEERKRPGLPAPVFTVRPLFFDQPSESAELLSRAVTKLAQSLRRLLDALGKQMRHDELAAWTFNPELDERQVDLTVQLRRSTARCRLRIVSFDALGRRVAFVPAL